MNFRKKGLGAIKDKSDKRDYLIKKYLKKLALPTNIDYEAKMSPVKDQAQRGACVAFASCAVREYQENKEANFKKQMNFSEEWTYEQIRQAGGGANPRDAFKLFDYVGVCPESDMRYKKTITDNTENRVVFKPTTKAVNDAALWKTQTYARITTLNDMKLSLVQNGPFMIGVNWLDGWFNPTTKLNNYPVLNTNQGQIAGGHALAVVGYDDTNKVFKFKNSWSTSWGNKGYAYFTYDVISKNLLDAWANIDV